MYTTLYIYLQTHIFWCTVYEHEDMVMHTYVLMNMHSRMQKTLEHFQDSSRLGSDLQFSDTKPGPYSMITTADATSTVMLLLLLPLLVTAPGVKLSQQLGLKAHAYSQQYLQ